MTSSSEVCWSNEWSRHTLGFPPRPKLPKALTRSRAFFLCFLRETKKKQVRREVTLHLPFSSRWQILPFSLHDLVLLPRILLRLSSLTQFSPTSTDKGKSDPCLHSLQKSITDRPKRADKSKYLYLFHDLYKHTLCSKQFWKSNSCTVPLIFMLHWLIESTRNTI